MSDFFLPLNLSAPADTAVVAAWQKVLISAQQNIPWLPNLTAESSSLFKDRKLPRLNPIPEGLTPEQQKQWKCVYDAMSPIDQKAVRGEMQAAALDGQRLAANTAFWEGVHRITAAAATIGYSEIDPIVKRNWVDMQARIKEWDETRAWALKIAAHKDCPPEKAAKIRRQALARTDDAHTHRLLVKLSQILADETLQKPHQVEDLLGRSRPVFRREGIERQIGNAEVGGSMHRATHRLDATTMSLKARQGPGRRPAAVAIHDDPDMSRTVLALRIDVR
jgi:hypothetical protein